MLKECRETGYLQDDEPLLQQVLGHETILADLEKDPAVLDDLRTMSQTMNELYERTNKSIRYKIHWPTFQVLLIIISSFLFDILFIVAVFIFILGI